MVEIGGVCDSRFDAARDVLAKSIEAGEDLGASFAVCIDGQMVVDIWGGHLDEARSRPWQQDTIVNVYSTTKTMTFLCALVLADRGLLDFDANVAEYWPEFAAAGKGDVKVWHIMDHAAGLSGLDEPISGEDLYEWDKVTGLLAGQAPWWKPGTATAYHAVTQGYLIGEVVRRITGKTIGTFFREEIAEPLAADFHIGVPDSEFHRIGNLVPPPGDSIAAPGDPDSIAARTFRNPPVSARQSHTDEWRRAEIPAANGHGNARSVALIQSAVACGGKVGDVQLIGPKTAALVMQERISGQDMALGTPVRFGLGYGLNSVDVPISPNERVCYWGGWGGSVILVDQDARMTVSYIMNKMHSGLTGDMRSANLVGAVYQALAS